MLDSKAPNLWSPNLIELKFVFLQNTRGWKFLNSEKPINRPTPTEYTQGQGNSAIFQKILKCFQMLTFVQKLLLGLF